MTIATMLILGGMLNAAHVTAAADDQQHEQPAADLRRGCRR
jgi:hypothetical protein